MSELLAKIEDLGSAIANWRSRQDKRLQNLERLFDEMDKRLNREDLGGTAAPASAVARKATDQAIRNMLRTGKVESLSPVVVRNAMSVGSDPGGGYVVVPEIQDGISQILRNVSPFRTIARIQPVTMGDAFEERYSLGGAGTSWVGELGSRTSTSLPELKKLRVPLNETYAMPEASQRLVDDADTDIVAWLNGQVGTAFAEQEGAAFVSGDGVIKPRGFLTYTTAATADVSRAWETLQHVSITFGSSPDTAGDSLIDAVYALKAGYRREAVWAMNSLTAGTVRKIKNENADRIWVDSLAAGQPPLLLGFPVVMVEDMPDIASGQYPIAFGNFREGYLIADRPGIRLLVDPFTNKPHVRLYTYRRVGGDVRDFNAIKLLKVA